MASLAMAAADAASARCPRDQGIAYDRLMLVMLLFAGAIFLIAARLAHLQIATDGTGRSAAAAGLPPRGEIVDRNGVVLATTIEAWAIGVQPANIIGDKADLAAKLNELMPEQSAEWYLQQLNSKARFTYLRRSAEPELVEAVNALGDPGITFGKEPERLYPQGPAWRPRARLGRHRRPGRGRHRARAAGPADLRRRPAAGRWPFHRQPRPGGDGGRARPRHDQPAGAGRQRHHAGCRDRRGGGAGLRPDLQPQRAARGDAGRAAQQCGPGRLRARLHLQAADRRRRDRRGRNQAWRPLGRGVAGDARPPFDRRQPPGRPLADDAGSADQIVQHRHRPHRRADGRSSGWTASSASCTSTSARIRAARAAGPIYPRSGRAATVLTTSFGHSMAVTPLHLASAYAPWSMAACGARPPCCASRGRRRRASASSPKKPATRCARCCA
jgi:cell division protein FtsI (penicillin-binding protein 3)